MNAMNINELSLALSNAVTFLSDIKISSMSERDFVTHAVWVWYKDETLTVAATSGHAAYRHRGYVQAYHNEDNPEELSTVHDGCWRLRPEEIKLLLLKLKQFSRKALFQPTMFEEWFGAYAAPKGNLMEDSIQKIETGLKNRVREPRSSFLFPWEDMALVCSVAKRCKWSFNRLRCLRVCGEDPARMFWQFMPEDEGMDVTMWLGSIFENDPPAEPWEEAAEE